MSQLDMFGSAAPQASTVPTAEAVRARLDAVLRVLSEADAMPWAASEIRSWNLVVPQMSNWLPAEERDAVRAEFARHMARLGALAA